MKDGDELDFWRLWKLTIETVRGAILEEVKCSSGLSEADLAVLFRLAEHTGREVRQHELGASMRWHRSRLSHQLTRMEQRGLLRRKNSYRGVTVALTDQGARAFETVQPIFVAAVRRHFIDRIPNEHKKAFRSALELLAEGKS